MARKGYRTVGLDLSAESLDFARQRCRGLTPMPELHRGDMAVFDLGQARFALAFNLVSSFKYLLDDRAAASHLCCVYDALAPGGVYLLGLHVVDYEYHAEQGDRERWHADADGLAVDAKIFSSVPDPETRTESVAAYLRVTRAPGDVQRLLCRFPMRTYDVAELFQLVRTCGRPFEVAEVYDFDYRPSDPRENDDQLAVLLVLRRPQEGLGAGGDDGGGGGDAGARALATRLDAVAL